ncbi:hypothetical protein LIER_39453 [Lithospermum erythrorhizon]|uniref:Uncharacterized protein n=1 Tax=Lithospermum erythrorhizon TaxID=34254 RepID=A0AAV3QHI3_LITER
MPPASPAPPPGRFIEFSKRLIILPKMPPASPAPPPGRFIEFSKRNPAPQTVLPLADESKRLRPLLPW